MDIKITKLKEFADYEEDYLTKKYAQVLHINKLDSDKDKAAVQIITAFNQIHDIVSENPEKYKLSFDILIKPSYEKLITERVEPVTFASKVLTSTLLNDLDKLKKSIQQ